ncbi:MAG: hypothetical protein ABRQ25_03230 [Clostridiaceae bacterium]
MDEEEKRDVTASKIKKAGEVITEAAEEAQEEQQNIPESGTGTSGSTTSGSTASRDTLQTDLANLAATLKSISDIRETLISLELSEVDKVYFDRSVRPLLDYINLLAFSTISLANAGATFQGSFLGRKKEIEQALDLSYDINKQLRCIFEVLKERTAKYLSLENEEI